MKLLLVSRYQSRKGLLVRHKELSEAVRTARDRWDDTRRPGAWAAVYLGLEAWAVASEGVVAAPSLEVFVRDVAAPVEMATFEEPVNALDNLRGWLAVWVQRNIGEAPSSFTGTDRVNVKDGTKLAGVRAVEARFVTGQLLKQYRRDMEKQPEVQFNGLKDVAREVARQYGVDPKDLFDGKGDCRVRTMADHVSRERAVPIPMEAPGIPGLTEEGA